MKITIGGLSGTGTSTIGKLLAKKLGYEFMSGGNMFRAMAQEMDMTVEDFDVFTQGDFSYDKALDAMQKKFGEENNAFVLESRLGWFNVPDSFKVKLHCDDQIRFERTSKADVDRVGTKIEDFEATRQKSLKREEDHRSRMEKLYGIKDLNDDTHFDLVLDTSTKTPDQIVDEIIVAMK
jgi:CMP/dCMP kinase